MTRRGGGAPGGLCGVRRGGRRLRRDPGLAGGFEFADGFAGLNRRAFDGFAEEAAGLELDDTARGHFNLDECFGVLGLTALAESDLEDAEVAELDAFALFEFEHELLEELLHDETNVLALEACALGEAFDHFLLG